MAVPAPGGGAGAGGAPGAGAGGAPGGAGPALIRRSVKTPELVLGGGSVRLVVAGGLPAAEALADMAARAAGGKAASAHSSLKGGGRGDVVAATAGSLGLRALRWPQRAAWDLVAGRRDKMNAWRWAAAMSAASGASVVVRSGRPSHFRRCNLIMRPKGGLGRRIHRGASSRGLSREPWGTPLQLVLVPKDPDARVKLADLVAEHNSWGREPILVPFLESALVQVVAAVAIQSVWRGRQVRMQVRDWVQPAIVQMRAAVIIQRNWSSWKLRSRLAMLAELKRFTRLLMRKKRRELYFTERSLALLERSKSIAQYPMLFPEQKLEFMLDPYHSLFIACKSTVLRQGLPAWVQSDIPLVDHNPYLVREATRLTQKDVEPLLARGCEVVEVDTAVGVYKTMLPLQLPAKMIRFQSEVEAVRRAVAVFLLTWSARTRTAARLLPSPSEGASTPHLVAQSSDFEIFSRESDYRDSAIPSWSVLQKYVARQKKVPRFERGSWKLYSQLGLLPNEYEFSTQVPPWPRIYTPSEKVWDELELWGEEVEYHFEDLSHTTRAFKKQQHERYQETLQTLQQAKMEEMQQHEKLRQETARTQQPKFKRSTNTSSLVVMGSSTDASESYKQQKQQSLYDLEDLQQEVARQRQANVQSVTVSQRSLTETKKEKAEAVASESERIAEMVSLRGFEEEETSRARTAYRKEAQAQKIKARKQRTNFVSSFVNQSNSLNRIMHQNGRRLNESVSLYQVRERNQFMRQEAEYKKAKAAEMKEQKRMRTREKHIQRKELLSCVMLAREDERRSRQGRRSGARDAASPEGGDKLPPAGGMGREALKMGQVTSVSQVRSSRRKK